MTRLRNGLLGLLALVLLVAGVIRLISTNGPVAPTAPSGLEELVVPSAGVIRWSPDATRLALLVAGEMLIVRVADGAEVARRGSTVVDVAWMPDAERVILVEGPIPTGQAVAVQVDGRVAGTTTLRPSIAFGMGQGLAIDDKGRRAAAIAAQREAIGGATRHDLALVELQSGATRVISTEDREESNPVFADDVTVAYASRAPSGETRLHVIDTSTDAVTNLGRIHDGPFGVLASGEVVVGHRAAQGAYRLDAVSLDGESRVLGVLRDTQRPVAIDRFGTRVLVRRFGGLQGTRLAIAVLSK
ncbi:MAG: hypothetical protein Q8K63_01845 [Acidimicrobiales bacterium]|nr:hypothetical protein [Acidimicrobiales bacterium]